MEDFFKLKRELTAPPQESPAPAPPSAGDSCSLLSHPHRPGHGQFGSCSPYSSPLLLDFWETRLLE